MPKVQFQGYAQGKGFSSIDPGYAELSRTREKFQEDLSNVKDQQRKAEQRDANAEANLERVMRNEEANRKEIYIEDKVISTRERALDKNRSIETENFKAKQKEREQKLKDFESIIGFSKTALESVNEIRKKNWDATADQAYNYYMTHGLSIEDQIKLDLIEDKNWQTGQNFELEAQRLQEEGYTHQEVSYVRGKNKAADYGRLKAYSVMAGNQFGAWANAQLAKMDHKTPEQKQAALEVLRIEYLKAHNLYGVSSDFLNPMFTKMRSASDQIIGTAQLQESIQLGEQRVTQANEVLMGFIDNPESRSNALLGLYQANSMRLDARGLRISPTQSKQFTFESLADIDNFPSDEAVMELLRKTKFAGQNKSWADANPEQVRDLILKRTKARKLKDQNTKLVIDAKKKEEKETFKAFLDDPTRWNGDQRVVQQGIDQLRASGHTTEELAEFLPYLDQSVQGRNDGDYHLSHINGLIEDHRLTTEDLKGPFVPQALKSKHWKKATENEAIFKAAKIKQNIKPALKTALRNALKLESLDSKSHSSLEQALYHAETEFREQLLNDVTAKDALQNVIDDIKKGIGKFSVVNPGDKGADPLMSFFGSFVPGSHQNAAKVTPTATTDERIRVIDKVDADPNILTKELLIHPERLTEIRDAIANGKSYRLPEICFDLSQADPERFGSPLDVWHTQLKAADLDSLGLKIENFSETLFRDTDEPLGKKMLKNLKTKADLRKVLQTTYNPSSVRDPRYMSPNVVKAMAKTTTPDQFILDDFIHSPDPQAREILKNDDDYGYIIKEGYKTGSFYNYSIR